MLAPLHEWKRAIRETISYALCLGLLPEIALYGDLDGVDTFEPMYAATQYRVYCDIWDVNDLVGPAESNLDDFKVKSEGDS